MQGAAVTGLFSEMRRHLSGCSRGRGPLVSPKREASAETEESVAELEDREYLLGLGLQHPNAKVARAAAMRLAALDDAGRAGLMRSGASGARLARFEASGHAERLARGASSWWTRKFATEHISSQALLLILARSDSMPEVRSVAVSRLEDQQTLLAIAIEEECLAVSETALARLSAESSRAQVARGARDWRARDSAVKKCSDLEVIEDRLFTDPEARVRATALRKIISMRGARPDDRASILQRVATNDPTDHVALAALSALTDAHRVAIVAKEARSPAVRAEALQQLAPTDPRLPLEALNMDPDHEVRAEAIRQLRSPTVLAEVMVRADLPETLRSIAGRTWHRRSLETNVEALGAHLARGGGETPRIERATVRLAGRASGIMSVGLFDGGRVENTFADVARLLRDAYATPVDDREVARRLDELPQPRSRFRRFPDLVRDGGAEWKVVGRTIIATSRAGETIALKLAKRGEDPRALDGALEASPLTREWKMDHLLCALAKELGLESALPEPLEQGPIVLEGVPKELVAAIQSEARKVGGEEFRLASDGADHFALAYRHPAEHHTYLNDPSVAAARFREATDRCLGDAARLMRAGLFPTVSADFMHNLADQRSYHWNTDDLRRPPRSTLSPSLGAGRLHSWRRCVAYVNFRLSGLADSKYLHLARDLVGQSRRAERLAPHAREEAQLLAEASIMGDVLFAWALTAADSALARREAIARKIEGIELLDLAAELCHGSETFLMRYSGRDREPMSQLLTEAEIDFDRMAYQFEVFTGEGRFEELARNGRFDRDVERALFGGHVEVRYEGRNSVGRMLTITEGRGFRAENGWSIDGKNQDLGPVNGPFPPQDLIRALFAITTLAPVAHTFDLGTDRARPLETARFAVACPAPSGVTAKAGGPPA